MNLNPDADDNFRNADTLNQSTTSIVEEYLSIWQRYNKIFLITFSIQNFNGGLKFMFMLAYQDMFKNYYNL